MIIGRTVGYKRLKNPVAAYRARRVVSELGQLLAQLYGNGEQGVMYIPKPVVLGQQVLWQDAAGTVPVLDDGDPVFIATDISGNDADATSPTSGARRVYRTDGTRHWLEDNLLDDLITVTLPSLGTDATLAYVDDVGVKFFSRQDYSGETPLPTVERTYGLLYIDRALTTAEKAQVRSYFASLAGHDAEGVPGNQTLLAGDMDAGWYGEVPTSEFLRGDELADALGVTEGVGQEPDAGWLKFARNGTQIFVQKRSMQHSISWDHTYSRGLVYGTDDDGLFPRDTPTNQLRHIEIGGELYKVRLLTGAASDPIDATKGDSEDSCTFDLGGGSEWNELIYRVHQDEPFCGDPNHDTNHGGPQVGGNWASYSNSDLGVVSGNGRGIWTQETASDSTSNRVRRGDSASVARFNRSIASFALSFLGLRLVLELVEESA